MRSTRRPAPLVAAYFDNLPEPARQTALALQQAVLAAEPRLEPGVRWGNLVFSLDRRHVLAIVAHKAHANLQFFQGAALARDFPMLEGAGKGARQVKLRYSQSVDEAGVAVLVRAAVALAGLPGAPGDAGPG